MATAKAQYTPEQILEAGRRAEAQGQYDYALQFYHHLTEFHPGAREAPLAHEAIQRLQVARAAPPLRPAPTPAGHPDLQRAPDPLGAHRSAPAAHGPRSQPSPALPSGSGMQLSVGAATDVLPAFLAIALPTPLRGYRIGRALAWGMIGLGFVSIVCGFALAVAMLVANPRDLPAGAAGSWSLMLAGSLVPTGLVMVLLGQAARALFDTANAARDVSRVLRAMAEAGRGRKNDHG